MPKIGEVKSAKELGHKSSSAAYVYSACPQCGKPRWVKRASIHNLCVRCARLNYVASKKSGELDRLIASGQAKLVDGVILHKHNCRVCGKELWHQKRDISRTCSLKCARTIRAKWDKSPQWNGGQRISHGYIEIRLQPNDPFFAMATRNHYVRQHRLVMAQHLGRCLEPWEVVHHINGDIKDNRLENLELMADQASHTPSIVAKRQFNILNKRVATLEAENKELKAEIALLKWHISDIRCDIGNTEPSRSKDASGVCRDYGQGIPDEKGDSDIVRTS